MKFLKRTFNLWAPVSMINCATVTAPAGTKAGCTNTYVKVNRRLREPPRAWYVSTTCQACSARPDCRTILDLPKFRYGIWNRSTDLLMPCTWINLVNPSWMPEFESLVEFDFHYQSWYQLWFPLHFKPMLFYSKTLSFSPIKSPMWSQASQRILFLAFYLFWKSN